MDKMNKLDQYAEFYNDENLGFDLKLDYYAYQTYKKFFVGDNCLEVGASTGYMTKYLVKDFKHVVVIEGSKKLIEKIPDYPNIKKVNSLIEDYETKEKFDTIIMNHVLEHIEDPIFVLKKLKNYLSDNGRLIVGVPNANSLHRLAAVKMGLLTSVYELNERDKSLGHYRVYDESLLRKHLEESGFYIEHVGGIFLKFLSNKQIEEFLDEKILDAYYELSDLMPQFCALIYMICRIKRV
jgi:2-polyprenyl-3-methyl-5-hydroxy-6-metoxy-1,4-benzoquinol methylase